MAKSEFYHQSTVASLLFSLRNEILLGKYEGQCRLSETEIANEYHVSRSTVRAALHGLITDGLVVVEPNGRKYVRNIDQKYIEDLCYTRSVLEVEAARAILKKKNNDFTKLLQLVGEFYLALQEEDVEKRRPLLAQINEDFHDQMFVMSGNDSLIQCRRTIAPVLTAIVSLNASLGLDMQEHGYYESHRKIAQMLMDKDEEVVEYVRYHALDATVKDVLQAIERAKRSSIKFVNPLRERVG